ncbi:hypothetical protein D3C81_124780 [compost metagenome]|uniref:hypothetical protein n=1 Tax=unclassified Acinetobacter TaxID=196816 RepID=UPI000FB536B8|nr:MULTISPECIES: hypothetical protein [unclassified Acinetobacter]MDS7935159.1 hypothetical protein [Acinetobacter sp. V91_4B]MDS7964017.1 hypothetical protein [Acinetobacter sp. V91_7]MDS8027090.1 hypothetical protein [Acinetobacter sp. V91_13]
MIKKAFETSEFLIKSVEAIEFAELYDPIPIHIEVEPDTPFIKKQCVSGILIQCFINKFLINHPDYKGLICATNINIDFIKPAYFDTKMFIKVSYQQDFNNRKNAYRRISNCELISSIDEKIITKYEVTHLIKI